MEATLVYDVAHYDESDENTIDLFGEPSRSRRLYRALAEEIKERWPVNVDIAEMDKGGSTEFRITFEGKRRPFVCAVHRLIHYPTLTHIPGRPDMSYPQERIYPVLPTFIEGPRESYIFAMKICDWAKRKIYRMLEEEKPVLENTC